MDHKAQAKHFYPPLPNSNTFIPLTLLSYISSALFDAKSDRATLVNDPSTANHPTAIFNQSLKGMSSTTDSSYTDEELLRRLRRSDRAAFEEIYNRYHAKIYRYTLAFLKIPGLAEDCVHEVLLKIWEIRETSMSTKTIPHQPAAWIVRLHADNNISNAGDGIFTRDGRQTGIWPVKEIGPFFSFSL